MTEPIKMLREEQHTGQGKEFVLRSLDAFDDLVDRGFAIQFEDGGPDDAAGEPTPRLGNTVYLSYIASVWNGAQNLATEFEDVEAASFVVGAEGPEVSGPRLVRRVAQAILSPMPQFPAGLHAALRYIPARRPVSIVLGPQAAFGEDGLPPHVPPLANILYEVFMEQFDETEQEIAPPPPPKPAMGAPSLPPKPSLAEEPADLKASLESRYGSFVSAASSRTSFVHVAARKPAIPTPAAQESAPSATYVGGFRELQKQRRGTAPVTLQEAEAALR